MARRDQGLLGQLELGVVDESTSITSLLQKCILLGGKAGSTRLRDWARQELSGYSGSDDEVPEYRKIGVEICIDGQAGMNLIRGQPISPWDLPEVAREAGIDEQLDLRQGIGELEDLAQRAEPSVNLAPPMASTLVKLMNDGQDPMHVVHRVYYSVSRVAIRGVVVQVRTALAELVGELIAEMPEDQDTPSKDAVDRATQYILTGKRSSMTVVNSSASDESASTVTVNSEPPSTWWERWKKRGMIVGSATVVAAGIAVAAYFQWFPWA